MAVISQQQGGFEYFAVSKNKLHGLDCHGNWAGLVFEVEGRETQKKKERERERVSVSTITGLTSVKCCFIRSNSVTSKL